MKIIAFDIWGNYGHFRKFYTTISPLTFSFPPPMTLAGILGAIYGTEKNTNEYLKVFGSEGCKIAVRIINPVKKIRMGLNLLETKGRNLKLPMSDKNLAPRTQIRAEFLKDSKFRFYISHEDGNVFNRLVGNVEKHESFYTVSLGLSELLADFKYVGVYSAENRTNDEAVELVTTFTADNLIANSLEVEAGKKYFKEKMPIIMNQNRVVERYDDVIFEPDGKTIKARIKRYCKLENGENIAFF